MTEHEKERFDEIQYRFRYASRAHLFLTSCSIVSVQCGSVENCTKKRCFEFLIFHLVIGEIRLFSQRRDFAK